MRALALLLAFGIAGSVFLVADPAAATFQGLQVQPGRYTGTNLYVPEETMVITVTATPGDVYDIEIFHWIPPFGARSTRQTFDDEVVPASGQRTVTWLIPNTMEDSTWYWVAVYDGDWFETGRFSLHEAYLFEIRGYNFNAWLSRTRYIPGDTVTVGWSATLVRDGSAAPAGVGEIQAYNGPSALVAPYAFNASQGTFSFRIGTAEDPNRDPFVQVWFNDTTGNRRHAATIFFDIGFLDLLMSLAPTYAPGAVVTIDVWAKAAPSPGGAAAANPGVAGAFVNITISDVATGAQTSYGAMNLLTAADGRVTHVFPLASTPTSAVYNVQVRGTAHGVLVATESGTFEVRSTPRFLVQLVLDRSQYVSGDTATATASADPTGPNLTYQWQVRDIGTGSTILQMSTGQPVLTYAIPGNFTGSLEFRVTVNDGAGNSQTVARTASVAYGYLAVSLDRTQFTAGETITASTSLRSVVMANPSYFYEVRDASGALVAFGNLTGSFFSYRTPVPASGSYSFRAVASDAGRVVQGFAEAFQASGFILSVSLDRPSYLPGETMRIGYALTARGPATWPSLFMFGVNLAGATFGIITSTTPTGELLLRIPEGTNEGDLILLVTELNTGTQAIESVHIGPTNPLWTTDVAGIPTFAVILAILVALLLVGFVYLWRKIALGGVPRVRPERPAAPPPPAEPVRGPPASPMSVPCRNCGSTIDITTSKRPIEVMCPSCGETQLVQ